MPYKVRKTLGPPSRPDLQGPCVITDENGKILATMEGFGSEEQYQLACKIVGDGEMLEKMAEALERVSEDGHALLSMTIGSRIAVLEALQKYRERENAK